jgi:uncharacterized protein
MMLADLPIQDIADVCRQYHVRELSVFGSVARGEARSDSDVDLLVEFEPEAKVDYFTFFDLEERLAELLNRPVDLVSKRGLKDIIRDKVMADSEVVFAA